MRYFISTTILITILTYSISAQQISSEKYNKKYIHEDFKKTTNVFKIITNTNNYFILDKEEYLLSRQNKESEYIIIAENSNVSDFILQASIKIEISKNKQSSIGFLLKTEPKDQSGIIFEINTKREYRIKQMSGGKHEILSGQKKQEGWVRNNLVNGCDKYNDIEIRSEKNLYDIYINNKYLTTFFVPDLNNGKCGIIIGPETKARLSYYNINIKNNLTKPDEITHDTIEQLYKKIKLLEESNITLLKNLDSEKKQRLKSQDIDSEDLNRIIKKLKTEKSSIISNNKELSEDLLKQKNKIEELTLSLEQSNNTIIETAFNNTNLNKQVSNLNNQTYLLENEINIINTKNDSLKTINTQLKELFILKDFEKNGIKTSVINKKESLKKTNPKSSEKIENIYSVQIGVYMQEQSDISINIRESWHENTQDKTYIYYSGKFNSYQQATAHMKDLISKGYTNLFIVMKKQ